MKGWPTLAPSSKLATLSREMSVLELLPLGVAIFAIFGLLGPVIDILSGGRLPSAVTIRYTLFSGLVSIGYAFGLLRRNWWVLGSAIVFQITGFLAFRGATVEGGPPNMTHLTSDGIGVLVLMIVSYTSFLIFINVTAASYLRVRAEIELAHRIHGVLVPPIGARYGPFEFLGFSRPSGDVGGDLVDVVTGREGWFGYVADVSGHGVSSGLVMGMFKSALRMRLRQGGALAELLTDLNTVLLPLRSGSMFVTVACVGYRGGEPLEFAVAGHLPILRVRAGRVDEITTPQIPIAMIEKYGFSSSTVEVLPGDLLVLLTDGFTEVFDRHDHEFGLERAKELIVEAAATPLSEIADRLVAAARAHGRQLDDQTLLLIRRT